MPSPSVSLVLFGRRAFNPLSLAPQIWIDFSDATTLTLSGADITEARDKSGNARHLAPTANTPTSVAAVLNGKAVARFVAASSQRLARSAALLRAVTGWTGYILSRTAEGLGLQQCITVVDIDDSARATFGSIRDTGHDYAGGRRLSGDSFQNIEGSNTVSTTNFTLKTVTADFTNQIGRLYSNGTLLAENLTWSTAGASANDGGGISVGSAGVAGASTFYKGDIAEFLIFHSVHDAAQRASMEAYFSLHWGSL